MMIRAAGSLSLLVLALGAVTSACAGESSSAKEQVAVDEELPLLDAVPEYELPAGFDSSKEFSLYRLRDGRRVAILSASDGAGAEATAAEVSQTKQALQVDVRPSRDTWVRRMPPGATQDFGKSCELRVNNILNGGAEQNFALLQFTIPAAVSCFTISSARLVLKTAQLPTAAQLVVFPHRVTQPWTAGGTGLANCASCNVSSGASAPFVLPQFSPPGVGVPINQPCTSYSWDLTSIVAGGLGWCAQPAQNFGVMVAGRNGAITVNFHSNEALSAANRPRLVIVF